MPKKKEYTSVAMTTQIAATSRCSMKVTDGRGNDWFYTFEYGEQRNIPDLPDVDLDKERELLWDDCNAEVDRQVEDVIKLYSKKEKK